MTNLGFLTMFCKFCSVVVLLLYSGFRFVGLILFCYSSPVLGDGLWVMMGLLIRIHVHSRTGGARGWRGEASDAPQFDFLTYGVWRIRDLNRQKWQKRGKIRALVGKNGRNWAKSGKDNLYIFLFFSDFSISFFIVY